MRIIIISFVLLSFLSCKNPPDTWNERIKSFESDTTKVKESNLIGWKNLEKEDSSIIISMPYATTDNFLKEKIYPCAKCYLREDAAKALLKAQKLAQSKGYSIIIYDCYRPLPLQQKMFDIIPDTKYVADPKRGSRHNKGVAVDISLANEIGEPLNMGTAFDDFSEQAHFSAKNISAKAKANRKLLRDIMLTNDFTPYDNEWWHFNYKNTDFPNENFVWDCKN